MLIFAYDLMNEQLYFFLALERGIVNEVDVDFITYSATVDDGCGGCDFGQWAAEIFYHISLLYIISLPGSGRGTSSARVCV